MKRQGFTLLELVVVMIIMGILATLGFSQYTRMIERARGAEARQVLGAVRTQAAALYMERRRSDGTLPASDIIQNSTVGIGTLSGQIPQTCTSANSGEYYFSYGIQQNSDDTGFIATATRCTGTDGKSPSAAEALTLNLTTNFSKGSDVWGGSGGY